jgi:hypothetical protein
MVLPFLKNTKRKGVRKIRENHKKRKRERKYKKKSIEYLEWKGKKVTKWCFQKEVEYQSEIKKNLEIKRKEARNSEKESIFSLLGKPSNFNKGVMSTPSPSFEIIY